MKPSRMLFLGSAVVAALAIPAFLNTSLAAPPAPPNTPPAATAQPACKTFGAGKCCDPNVTMHLAKEAIFAACGESDATFLGEAASKETCKFHFKVEGENSENTYVQVYVPVVKEVPQTPTDPFMSYKKVGKVWMTDKAKSPKAAPILANSTGMWLPGKGFFVSVAASTKVCTKNEAVTLSKSIK